MVYTETELKTTPITPEKYAVLVDRTAGITIAGVRSYPNTYMIRDNGGVPESIDSTANQHYSNADFATVMLDAIVDA